MATVSVSITDSATGAVVHTETRRAFNAGIRASEAAVREIARSEGTMYEAPFPDRVGDVYTRSWTSWEQRTLVVTVSQEV